MREVYIVISEIAAKKNVIGNNLSFCHVGVLQYFRVWFQGYTPPYTLITPIYIAIAAADRTVLMTHTHR